MKISLKTNLVTAAILAMTSASAVHAQAPNVVGGSSDDTYVKVGPSNFPPPPIGGPLGYAGLSMMGTDGQWSAFIDLYDGPVTQVSKAVLGPNGENPGNANQPGPYYAPFPLNPVLTVAQVWLNNESAVANVYSLRQTLNLPMPQWPKFGGLVVGQVKGTSKGDGVYFGEWSRSIGSTGKTDSANLNMTDEKRTVWFAGDNAVTAMPTLVSASYDVVGISQTGTDANGTVLAGGLPHAPNLYTGVLVANYNGSSGDISGAISRNVGDVTQSVDFAGTNIESNGSFGNGAGISGHFYNNADALAGIYKGASASDHVAFGGQRQ